jgi:hypothetical protein
MHRLILLLAIPFALINSISGQTPLNSESIADSLIRNANAVIRFNTTTYDRTSVGKYSKTIHYAITILNSKGISEARLLIPYNRNSKVVRIEGYTYNSLGMLMKKINKKDIQDYASNNSYTLYSDNRIKHCNPVSNTYPFSVEYKYTIEYDGVVGFGSWVPQTGFNISVEKSELIFRTPVQLELKYKELNHSFDFNQSADKTITEYNWQVNNLKAIEYEPYSPDYLSIFPAILLTPVNISYEGTSGDFISWQSYGLWVHHLIENRDNLPDETVLKMQKLTDTINDIREKAKAVYQYMQQNTRYVNISLGIGGFQPIMASDVDEKGYGDCKALSNYTRALLKSVGVASYYAEIGNGLNKRIKYPEFPSVNQTNHVILCVPMEDTLWLECTNQNIPCGYIGRGNADRYALLITAQGGVLAKTPEYSIKDNHRNSTTNITLFDDGHAGFDIRADYKNYLFEDVYRFMHKSGKEQEEGLLKSLSARGLEINNFSIEDQSDKHALGELRVNGTIHQYGSKTGKRWFVISNSLLQMSTLKEINTSRKYPIYQAIGYTYSDTLCIHIPEHYQIEKLPEDLSLNSSYGSFGLTYRFEDNVITIVRAYTINNGEYKETEFDKINKFLKMRSAKDNEKIILIEQ